MPKEPLDHTLIEIRRHRAGARKPVQEIADRVEGSPRALPTKRGLDEPRGVKLSNARKSRILFKYSCVISPSPPQLSVE
jgi:hypothetical protein